MKRTVSVAFVLLVVLPACGDRSRPEGVVERWLLALNQGAAGRPERYAWDGTSAVVLPDWETEEPGQLDVIEVGTATRTECSFDVPFRVVTIEGREIRGYGIIDLCPTASPFPVGGVELRRVPAGTFPSEGGRSIGTDRPAAWATAALIGVFFTIVSVGLMRLTRPRDYPERPMGRGMAEGGGTS